MARLELNPGVRLQDLQKFAESAGNQKIHLKMEGDVKVLYTINKKDAAVQKFFGQKAERSQQKAQNEIAKLLNSPTTSQNGHRSIRGSHVSEAVRKIKELAPQKSELLSKFPLDNSELPKETSAEFGKLYAKQLGVTHDDRMDLICNEPGVSSRFKEQLLQDLQLVRPDFKGKAYEELPTRAKAQIDSICSAAIKSMPKECCSEEMKTVEDRKDPNKKYEVPAQVVVNGNTYQHDGHIAKAGNGSVHRYVEVGGGDNPEKLAVKFPLKPTKMAQEAAIKEIDAHRAAQQDGDNAVSLKGVLRGPNNEVIIAMELAPYGDAHGFSESLHPKLNGGVISPQSAETLQKTVLQDMVRAAKQLNDNGMMHQDIKPANFLIAEGGHTKIADFGTSGVGHKEGTGVVRYFRHFMTENDGYFGNMATKPTFDTANPAWIAPEVLVARSLAQDKTLVAKATYDGAKKSIEKDLTKGFVGSDDEMKAKRRAILRENKNETKVALREMAFNVATESQFSVNEKAEIWALGISAYGLYKNEPVPPRFQANFDNELEKKVLEFSQNHNNRIFDNPQNDMEHLINWMCHPNPQQRPSAEDLLNSDYFKPPTGSEEARKMIMAVGSKAGNDELQKLELDLLVA